MDNTPKPGSDAALITQLKFIMNGYVHQILKNQQTMMWVLMTKYKDDAGRALIDRMAETNRILERLEKEQE